MIDRRVRTLRFVLLALLGVVLVGCGSKAPSAATPGGVGAASVSSAESVAQSVAGSGAAADAVNACALLDKAEVGALIGVTVDGVPNGVGARTGCVWENPTTDESVTVDIGAPGTAQNDTLPPLGEPGTPDFGSTPGPDGTRILMGAVEFAAGSRSNSVQVATPVTMSADQSIAAAMTLIAKIKPQLG